MHMYFQDIAIGSKWVGIQNGIEVTIVDKLANQDVIYRDTTGKRNTRDYEDFQNRYKFKSKR